MVKNGVECKCSLLLINVNKAKTIVFIRSESLTKCYVIEYPNHKIL